MNASPQVVRLTSPVNSMPQNGPPWNCSATRSGGDRGVRLGRLLGVVLRLVLGPIAQAIGVAVVVPGADVARDAVDDLEVDVRMLEADPHELGEIARADPDRQAAPVDRLVVDIADADVEHAQAVLVGVHPAERLAERLADAVARVGPRHDGVVDRALAAIEAHHVVGGGEDDALAALPARRLVDVVEADDVGVEDRIPRPLDRVAAEVDQAVGALAAGAPSRQGRSCRPGRRIRCPRGRRSRRGRSAPGDRMRAADAAGSWCPRRPRHRSSRLSSTPPCELPTLFALAFALRGRYQTSSPPTSLGSASRKRT